MFKLLKSIFGIKPKSYLVEGKYNIVPAFDWKGETFYTHADPLDLSAGRGLTSMVFMEELLMRCDVEYLREYIAARNEVYASNRVNIHKLAALDNMLKERIDFLVAVPDHVYKLASVIYFTKDESPFRYDYNKGMERVKQWQKEGAAVMYDFFLKTPMKTLLSSIPLGNNDILTSLRLQEKIMEQHTRVMREIRYSEA